MRNDYSPECPKCGGKMEYHADGPIYEGPHFYCLTANCGTLLFPVWEMKNG